VVGCILGLADIRSTGVFITLASIFTLALLGTYGPTFLPTSQWQPEVSTASDLHLIKQALSTFTETIEHSHTSLKASTSPPKGTSLAVSIRPEAALTVVHPPREAENKTTLCDCSTACKCLSCDCQACTSHAVAERYDVSKIYASALSVVAPTYALLLKEYNEALQVALSLSHSAVMLPYNGYVCAANLTHRAIQQATQGAAKSGAALLSTYDRIRQIIIPSQAEASRAAARDAIVQARASLDTLSDYVENQVEAVQHKSAASVKQARKGLDRLVRDIKGESSETRIVRPMPIAMKLKQRAQAQAAAKARARGRSVPAWREKLRFWRRETRERVDVQAPEVVFVTPPPVHVEEEEAGWKRVFDVLRDVSIGICR
jgi:hypothetical protein